MALSVLFFLGAAVVINTITPEQWTAETEVLVAGQDSTASVLSDLGLSEMALSLSNTDDIQNKIYLATSASVMREVAWRMQLRDSRGYLLEPDDLTAGSLLSTLRGIPQVEVTQVPSTDVLLVNATAWSPEAARLMADTLAQVYIDNTTDQARAETHEAQVFLQQQLAVVTAQLDAAFADVAQAQRDSEIIDLESEVRAAVSRLSDLLLEQEQIAGRIQELRAKIRYGEDLRATEGLDSISSTTMTVNPVIGDLRKKLTELRTTRDAYLADHYTARAPEVVRIDAQIAAIQRELEGALTEMSARDPAVEALRAELEGQRMRAVEVERAIASTTLDFSSYPDKMRALARLELVASAAEEVYRALQDQSFQIGVAEAMTMADVRILTPASLPDRSSAPTSLLNLVVALILGGGFGLASAMALEFLDDTVKDADRLRAHWDLPLLGQIPLYKVGAVPLVGRLPPSDPLVEAYQAIRRALTLSSLDRPMRLIGVSSSAPSEGKSTLAVNLALSYAKAGIRVLLVDADLRRPTQHRLFPELVSSPGLVELLTGDPSAAPQRLEEHGMDVLTAGVPPHDPAGIVESQRLAALLRSLLDRYEVIIVDTPPVLAVEDALSISRSLDGLLIALDTRHTTRRMLTELRRRLDAAGIKPVGVVLNKLRSAQVPYQAYARQYRHTPASPR